MTLDIAGEEKDRRRIDTAVFPTGEVRPQTQKKCKLYMSPYGYGVKNKRTTYMFHTGRELMSSKTLINSYH